MQKITPHLWFDKEAKEAAQFYTSVFPSSKINSVTTLRDTPSGDCDVVSFELAGQSFMSISAGPYFKFTPAISFMVACKTKDEVDSFWKKLNEGGQALMPLDQYPFSERYGWTQDKYGLSWQIMHYPGEIKQKITPVLMFVGEVAGKAEEAMRFYTSLFKDSSIGDIMRYGNDKAPDPEGTVAYASFNLAGQEFGAMDSAHEHHFNFNEAVSLMVHCKDQQEIDHYWEKMSAVPEAEQCGWLKDRFGVSWQITPASMEQMMTDKDPARAARVTQAFLKMKKFDLAELERAYRGEVGVPS
ncbi:VOC family protein [Dawidia soli]|uniref:VOC family protein n=1 Tax=Dawidia soli TaxID=2782352 RepID=A0AAP2D8I7_9BACT|nr:VOC family protein [Dawidia soli]MBT1686927.1 VOC family protein [Dawidia soli]